MDASAEIETLAGELEAAATALLDAAERGLALMPALRAGDASAIVGVEAALREVMQACTFQDIAGQRLSRLSSAGLSMTPALDPLLAGPQLSGEGLDQAAADALFGEI